MNYAQSYDANALDRINYLYSQDADYLRELAHIKRFLERYTGDYQFRAQILAGVLTLKDAAKACGCELDVESLRPVFHPSFAQFRAEATLSDWELAFKWDLYFKEMVEIRNSLHALGDTLGLTPQFDLWRQRNMARTNFELGTAASGIVHPTVAFELSSGCSVGCWFCGISAKKFGGHFTLAGEGMNEWEQILNAVQSVLGVGMKSGFLYWATDPLDNPDYVGFLEKYNEVVGIVPQTTTAIPLRNVELTRGVIKLWNDVRTVPNRFSVLSTGVLKRIHETFTPEELLGVEMVLQNKKSHGVVKFRAGRSNAKAKSNDVLAEPTDTGHEDEQLAEGTIACVTGFLVNIVERTVRLVSPTIPSLKWPDGYIVFESASYATPEDLRAAMQGMVARHMPMTLQSIRPLRFTDSVRFNGDLPVPTISSKWVRMESRDFIDVGRLISTGTMAPPAIVAEMCSRGVTPVKAVTIVESLWKAGVLTQAD